MRARAMCGSPCGYPRVATQDASDRFLLPYHSTPSTRVSSTSGLVARLSPGATRRIGRFTTLRSASAGLSSIHRHRRAFSSTSAPGRPSLWHPCRLPRGYPWRFRTHEPFGGRRDRFRRSSVKRSGFRDPRCLPSMGDFARMPGRVAVTGTLGVAFAPRRGFAAAARFSPSLRAQLPPLVREVSTVR